MLSFKIINLTKMKPWSLIVTLITIIESGGLGQVNAGQQVCTSRPGVYDGTDSAPALSLAQWREIYHELSQGSPHQQDWPAVVALTNLAREAVKHGPIPIAIINLPGRQLFCVAALQDYTHRGDRTVFKFERSFHFASDALSLPQLQVDFDDGLGLRQINFDEACEVTFASTGSKTIRVHAHYPEGQRRVASFSFHVQHPTTPAPHETWSVVAEVPYLGELGSGLAYVYLAESHTTLTNPVLIIEGFDLYNSMNWDELYYQINREELLETMRGEGFDFVLLNFADSLDYIQRNAYLAVALIQQIQQIIPASADLYIAGVSMGGIVGQYALSFMEQNGLAHNVRTFLAFDAPHLGANIPFGLQHWVDFFAPNSAQASLLRDILNQPSARQLLVYHYADSPPNSAASDPLRLTLLGELATLGNYPQNLRKVAIASGSGAQQDQGYPAGDQLVLYEYESFLVDIVGNVWAVPAGTGQVVFEGLVDQIWPLPDDSRTVYLEGSLPYDTAPGGFLPSMVQVDTTSIPYGDIIALQANHCFIPTISSLHLATSDLFYDIAGDPDIMSLTPFDAIYFPSENQEHSIITPENKLWFLAEVQGLTSSVATGGSGRPIWVNSLCNHPNPFNPATTISYLLNRDTPVTLKIFSMTGKQVRTLAAGESRPSGYNAHSWDGRDNLGRDMASGVYFYQVEVGPERQCGKMLLVK